MDNLWVDNLTTGSDLGTLSKAQKGLGCRSEKMPLKSVVFLHFTCFSRLCSPCLKPYEAATDWLQRGQQTSEHREKPFLLLSQGGGSWRLSIHLERTVCLLTLVLCHGGLQITNWPLQKHVLPEQCPKRHQRRSASCHHQGQQGASLPGQSLARMCTATNQLREETAVPWI